MEDAIQLPEQKEHIKLMRMSKGYNWEIKIFLADDKTVIERLEHLDNDLRQIYSQDGTND